MTTLNPTHDFEDDSHRHAFGCDRVFRDEYTSSIDAEMRPGDAIAAAWAAHDRAVDWTYENVPLN